MGFKDKFVAGSLVPSLLLAASMTLNAAGAPVERPQHSTTVAIGDLNLDQPGAAALAYERLSAAAKKVCSSRALTGYYYTYSDYRACVAGTVQKAVSDVNHPALTAFYQHLQPSRAVLTAIQ